MKKIIFGGLIAILLLAGVGAYWHKNAAPKHCTVVYRHEQNSLAAIHLILPGLRSREKSAGTTALTMALLDHGTGTATRLELARQAEALGARYSFDCNADDGSISLVCPGAYLPQAVDFLRTLLGEATLPEEEFHKMKKEFLANREEEKADPFIAGMNANRRLQYTGHYYQDSASGTVDSIAQISRQDCLEMLTQMRRPEKVIVVVNGGYPRLATRQSVRRLLTVFTPESFSTVVPVPQKPDGLHQLQLPMQTETGLLLANFSAPAIGKQYALYRFLETYLGRGLSSPLFVRVRDANGIGYKVGATYEAYRHDGLLTFFVQTNQKNKAVLAARLFELSALTRFDAAQATRAREYLLTAELKNRESTAARGYETAWNIAHGLPRTYSLSAAVKKITARQLQQALEQLHIQNTVTVD